MNGCFIVEENPASAHVGRWDKVATILCLVSENEVVDWRIIHPDKSESGNFTTIAAFAVLARQGTPLSPKMEQERARLRDG